MKHQAKTNEMIDRGMIPFCRVYTLSKLEMIPSREQPGRQD